MAEPLVELKTAADGKGQSSSPATVLPSDLYHAAFGRAVPRTTPA